MDNNLIISDLLVEFKTLQPDLQKFAGNPAPALAERLIIFINKMTPHADLFADEFKLAVKRYILAYQAKNEAGGENIFSLVKPTTELIERTLLEMNHQYN